MKRITTALIAACLCISANAQLLWKVTGNGAEQPSYIFGTNHIMSADKIPGFNAVEKAITEVQEVYGELDMDQAKDPQAMQLQMMSMMAPADSTLSRLLTPAQLDTINVTLGKIFDGQVTAANFEPLRPTAASAIIAVGIYSKLYPGIDPTAGVDGKIQELARKADKAVKGLETVAFQCEMLYGMPLTIQAQDLLYDTRDYNECVKKVTDLNEAYLSGDIETLAQLGGDSGRQESYTDRILYGRNRNWAEQLSTIIPATPVLVAVGSGHLGSDKGLIALLRQKGFSVEPVR